VTVLTYKSNVPVEEKDSSNKKRNISEPWVAHFGFINGGCYHIILSISVCNFVCVTLIIFSNLHHLR
jgi:hypothetical protein